MKEKNKGLQLIEGGKGKPKTRGTSRTNKLAAGTGLTVKQEAFAQGLAQGLSNADAYRRAYDATNMQPHTVHTEGCKLAARPDVNARVESILAERRVKHGMLSEKQGDRVWRNVWRLAEGENVPPSVQQAALALAAKMAGMLTDKVEIEQKGADSKTIEAELLERLQRLTA